MTELQNLDEQRLELPTMPFAEPRDHAMVWNLVADDYLEPRIPLAQPLDLAARALAVGVGLNQNTNHHRRRKRRSSRSTLAVMGL